MSASIAVVGAGPTGTCLVERICANAADLLGWPSLDVHVIDPHPPGGGRVWRRDQPDLLWMNSAAADVTLFTDESVRCEGPIRPGPTLAEWLGGDPGTFASRPAQNGYLSHVFRHAVATAPRGVRVHVHPTRAVDLADIPGGQAVLLQDGRTIEADAVILAQGHGDVIPNGEERALADLAARDGLRYLPTAPASGPARAMPRGVSPMESSQSYADTREIASVGMCSCTAVSQSGDMNARPPVISP
ncbi:FAD/NAD(P)-binding protein [Streptosporangium sp. NBC_01810]|uniref:FAD/NAD(P)-binding protein n=1 Tax=Streptosporangium sp. NBC_01810 TaxID=2975951 RepID=UPI002DD8A4CC|nr:FAD/NAD(P)-binding protein [Streptosporangium sp. NBC_01810]WSA23324.1 FAD/NAD(P)-binding protein [Streptosporangium sp. NBC_01810]